MDNEEAMITSLRTDSLSRYRTMHTFECYGEVKSMNDFLFFVKWAKQKNRDIYILGNGSNTLFASKKIKSLVLKNNVPSRIDKISDEHDLFEVSSSTPVIDVLNYCYNASLDSFYYLASVPAKVGGALAMNAGTGRKDNKTIYDFVESVTFIDSDNTIKVLKRSEMNLEHRRTLFTGCKNRFIVSAVFKFPNKNFGTINPIKERIQWAKQHQDNVAPNCGSVFSICNGRIIRLLKGLRLGKAYYTTKGDNWINNRSSNVIPILILIRFAKFLHIITRKKCELEQIIVK